jgi:ribosomal protein L11
MSAKDVQAEFRDAVNMTATELEKWLQTDESKAAGDHRSGDESTGHASGRHIVKILRKKTADLTAADEQHMAKVVGYVRRHLAQRPSGDVHDTTWRHSLMNWGHDPTK